MRRKTSVKKRSYPRRKRVYKRKTYVRYRTPAIVKARVFKDTQTIKDLKSLMIALKSIERPNNRMDTSNDLVSPPRPLNLNNILSYI